MKRSTHPTSATLDHVVFQGEKQFRIGHLYFHISFSPFPTCFDLLDIQTSCSNLILQSHLCLDISSSNSTVNGSIIVALSLGLGLRTGKLTCMNFTIMSCEHLRSLKHSSSLILASADFTQQQHRSPLHEGGKKSPTEWASFSQVPFGGWRIFIRPTWLSLTNYTGRTYARRRKVDPAHLLRSRNQQPPRQLTHLPIHLRDQYRNQIITYPHHIHHILLP
jgi:hypothetical protein